VTTGSTLIDRAVRVLRSGPTHTRELAERALDLRGHPGAAAQAVYALLGSDPRFRVDAQGVWSLAPDGEGRGAPLLRSRFAVVDVETTGGGPADRITEVAVVHVDQGRVGRTYHTLVNPGRPIPPWVQGLTGITDRMVASAPPFEGIAEELARRLEGRIFVAHNEPFDRRFVRSALLSAACDPPEGERLCTVRLGRFLVPGLPSHRLDALAAHFGIGIEGRHRALGDALATARLLLHLLGEAESRGIRDPVLRERGSGGGARRNPSRQKRAREEGG